VYGCMGACVYERMVSLASLASQSDWNAFPPPWAFGPHGCGFFHTTAAFLSLRYFSSDLSVWSTRLWLFSFGYCFFVVSCFYVCLLLLCVSIIIFNSAVVFNSALFFLRLESWIQLSAAFLVVLSCLLNALLFVVCFSSDLRVEFNCQPFFLRL